MCVLPLGGVNPSDITEKGSTVLVPVDTLDTNVYYFFNAINCLLFFTFFIQCIYKHTNNNKKNILSEIIIIIIRYMFIYFEIFIEIWAIDCQIGKSSSWHLHPKIVYM